MGYLNEIWLYLLMSAPYLLLGLLLAGVVHSYLSLDMVQKWLGKDNLSSVFKAALIGVPLPLCSCSVIPTAISLKESGASNSATSSFLISTPESGIDSVALTYALIDLPMAIFRPIAALVSALLAGVFQFSFNRTHKIETAVQKKSCCSRTKKNSLLDGVKYGFGKLLNDISVWLVIGILLGALISWLVPADFFLSTSPTWSRLAILLIGIPLYICATASTPIALALITKGLSPGAALLLLLVGPATNLANLAVLSKYIGRKGVMINIIAISIVGLAFSYLVDYYYAYYPIKVSSTVIDTHQHFAWWEQLSAVVLSLLLFKGIYIEKFKVHDH